MIWIVVLLLAAVPLAGVAYQAFGLARDARRFPAPGQLIPVGGHRLHAHFSDAAGPLVIFEAGIGASSVSWALVQRQLSGIARVCVYDRAGLGWSEPARSPRTLDNILTDLRALIGEPAILVGHSFGGLIALEYACRYKADLAGVVLVDPLAASEWNPVNPNDARSLARGVRLARRGALLARLGVVRFALALLTKGSRRIPKVFARISSGNGAPLTERLVGEVRKLPPEVWPVIRAHWCQPKSFEAMANHLESLPAIAAQCSVDCDLGDLPLVVLSASDSSNARIAAHHRIAKQSRNGTLRTAQKSGHWIQLDQPELIVSAIREVISMSAVNTRA